MAVTFNQKFRYFSNNNCCRCDWNVKISNIIRKIRKTMGEKIEDDIIKVPVFSDFDRMRKTNIPESDSCSCGHIEID